MNGLSEYVMPYMIQVVREYSTKVDELIQDKIDKQIENKQEELNKEKEQMQQNLYAQLMPAALPAPPPMGAGGDQYGGMGVRTSSVVAWVIRTGTHRNRSTTNY